AVADAARTSRRAGSAGSCRAPSGSGPACGRPCNPTPGRRTRTRDTSWRAVSYLFLFLDLQLIGDDRRSGSGLHRLALVHDHEESQHALVELHGPLVLREEIPRGLELRSDIVAGIALLDRVGQGALSPMRHVGERARAALGDEGDAGYYVVAQFEAPGDLLPE